jgi:TMEM175 potassium channel family protein
MSTDPAPGSRHDDLPGVERLLTLSDGVVAISLTLLVLQLKVPPIAQVANPSSASDLAAQLAKEGSQYVSYAIAFYVVAQFWLVHHRVFRHIAGHLEGLAWWNFAFLFTISVMPFTSDLLGQYGGNPLAVDIFAANLLLASLATQATLLFGRRNDLLHPHADERAILAGQARGVAMSIVIIVSIGLAWVNTEAAKYSWLLMAAVPGAITQWSARRGTAATR